MSDASMSSDDTDFNPDNLEAMSAKEEYDSEPSSTSDDTDGEEVSRNSNFLALDFKSHQQDLHRI